jgi:hypothetical protein
MAETDSNPSTMSEYQYSPLSPDCIRLLRLLPSSTATAEIQSELFEYPSRKSDRSSHHYEALSYVWGNPASPKSITVNHQNLHVTQNLHGALLRLRHDLWPRIVWIDAICIDQSNNKEKEHQIQMMAEIYAKASRVVVWLGEADDSSDEAMEQLRLAGEDSTRESSTETDADAISQLLQRPWFRRVWVISPHSSNSFLCLAHCCSRFSKKWPPLDMSSSHVVLQKLMAMPSA